MSELSETYDKYKSYSLSKMRSIYRLLIGNTIEPSYVKDDFIDEILTKYYGDNWKEFL